MGRKWVIERFHYCGRIAISSTVDCFAEAHEIEQLISHGTLLIDSLASYLGDIAY